MSSTSVEVIYSSDLNNDRDFKRVADPKMRQVAAALSKWVDEARASTNKSSLFDRGRYAVSDNPYAQMQVAQQAVACDDIVGGVAELTEGLTFQGIKWESTDADEADVFNQLAAEQDLDALVRAIWRDEFTFSQSVLAFWWSEREFTVRGETIKGNKRKKTYNVWCPTAVTTLDSLKVVPVGMMQFGQESLAWHATDLEMTQYQNLLEGNFVDELMARYYAGQYQSSDPEELQEFGKMSVDPARLIMLNGSCVKRHTLTRGGSQRFADIRLKRVFRLLDLKQHLMEADRVNLIGAANYILLVRKGSKEDPAYPEEIENLKQNFDYVAKLPVIISDHRLEIDIITPKVDMVLQQEKYDVLDRRIIASLLGAFSPESTARESSMALGRLVARVMENRRHMIRRFLEREIAKAVYNHPRNAGQFSATAPSLTFVPGNIQMDADQGFAQAVIALRASKELSRESVLEFFGFDQAVEAIRREIEEESGLDDIFGTIVPFGSPEVGGAAPTSSKATGGQGGRPAGGGTPSKNPAKAPKRTAKGTTSTKGS